MVYVVEVGQDSKKKGKRAYKGKGKGKTAWLKDGGFKKKFKCYNCY